jgi:hypothetical protein
MYWKEPKLLVMLFFMASLVLPLNAVYAQFNFNKLKDVQKTVETLQESLGSEKHEKKQTPGRESSPEAKQEEAVQEKPVQEKKEKATPEYAKIQKSPDCKTRDEFFPYIRREIVEHPHRAPIIEYKKNDIEQILAFEYAVRFPTECFDLAKNVCVVLDCINDCHYAETFKPHLLKENEHRLKKYTDYMKQYAVSGRGGRCDAGDELPKMIKLVEDYEEIASQAFVEAKTRIEEAERLRAEEQRKRQEEYKRQKAEEQRRVQELVAKKQREEKAKVDSVIQYATANSARLEKESKVLREELSGVWYHPEHGTLTVDLWSDYKIVSFGNGSPLPMQVGQYDKNNECITVFRSQDGQIVKDNNGRLIGLKIRKVRAGGREFKLGLSQMDGVATGYEDIFGFVRELKW